MSTDDPRQSYGLLAKERTIAEPGYNRWLVPPAALAIQLSIGMAYGFSVFWLPLSHAIGITKSVDCPANMSFFQSLFSTTCDWKISTLGWMFTLFFVFLGIAAAFFGAWLERVGPRKAAFVAALCWGGGFFISALGIYLHQIVFLWLGSGVIGGIGLGLGYISPVSTLIKWFPDRRGMATGLAIMGFGGGAMIGAPLANILINHFATPTNVGVWQTFLVMGAIYFIFMMFGAFLYRLPATGWKPAEWTAPVSSHTMITSGHVHVEKAWKTQQFWLIWWVLCLNVTAGIGIIGMASPMLQEIFGGNLLGLNIPFEGLSLDQKKLIAAIAAGFTGLLSLFNICGRIFWASLSDKIGRKAVYYIFFILGFILYASATTLANADMVALFVLAFGIILSMYGGGFATVPAYLSDVFGTQMVGAIHGRLLTAWAAAGIFGPVIVNYLREYEISRGVPRDGVYAITTYVLAGLLLIGLICNYFIKPVDKKHFMTEEELAEERKLAHEVPLSSLDTNLPQKDYSVRLIFTWAIVLIPLAWGVWETLKSAATLFTT